MRRASQQQLSRQLVTVRQHVEHWRKRHGGKGSRIPVDLWEEAVAVARVEGLYATAQALRFNYERLKEWVARAEGKERGNGNGRSAFVELEMGQLCDGGRTVIELVGRHGDRMRVDVTGASAVDVVGLTQSFWSRQS